MIEGAIKSRKERIYYYQANRAEIEVALVAEEEFRIEETKTITKSA